MQWHHGGAFPSFSSSYASPQGSFHSLPMQPQYPNPSFQTAGPSFAASPTFVSTTSPVARKNVPASRQATEPQLSAEQVQQRRENEEYKQLQSMHDTVARHHFVRNQAAEIMDSVDLLEQYVKAGADKESVSEPSSTNSDKELGYMGLNMFVDGYAHPPPNPEEQSNFDGLISISEADKILKQLDDFNKELLGGKWPERQIKKEAKKWKVVGAGAMFSATMSNTRPQSRPKTPPAGSWPKTPPSISPMSRPKTPPSGIWPKTPPSISPMAPSPDSAGGWFVQQASRSASRSPPATPVATFTSGGGGSGRTTPTSRQSTVSPPLMQLPGGRSGVANFASVSSAQGSIASLSPSMRRASADSPQAANMPSNVFQSVVAPPARLGSQGALLGQPGRAAGTRSPV